MANPRIEVEIGAKVEGLSAGVNQATSQLDKLGKSAQSTAPQIQKLTQATAGYNSIGTDFARIIQDAPFGIIGIGNNITQLAGSFQVLKNQTGSTGAAVKVALGSIFSSGNLLVLGISALTTVFTILQQKGFFKTEEAAKSLSDRLEEYREKLDNITKASLEGQINAQKEISSFKLLTVQAENTTLSLEKRLAAVNELRKQYPEYLKNLTDEQILTGNVGLAYQNLTKDILALAQAKAFQDRINKNSADILTLILEEEEKLLQVQQKQNKAAELRKSAREQTVRDRGGQNEETLLANVLESEAKDILKEINQSEKERAKLKEQNKKLESQIVEKSSEGANFAKVRTVETKKNVDEVQKLKRTFEDISKLDFLDLAKLERTGAFFEGVEKQLIKVESGAARTRGIFTQNIGAINKSNKELIDSLQGSGISIEQFYAAIANGAAEGFSSLESFITALGETQAFINKTFEILEQGAENTLGDVAFAIGDALASGGNVIKAAGAALLGGLAGILNQLGQLAIATGLTITGIKKALQTLNPAVAIGAGIALVALAGFVSSKAKSLGSAAPGGGGGGGGGSSVGSSGVGGGSSFVGGAQGGLFQQNRDVSGEFVVRGQDLVYVLGQANNRINKG
jgi:hypothetical protein